MSQKRSMTLLEVVVALVLLSVVGSLVGVKLHEALGKKKFETSVEKLFLELETCHRLALYLQADWDVRFGLKDGRIEVESFSEELGQRALSSWEFPCAILWDGKEVASLFLQFAASGNVLPRGLLQFMKGDQVISWMLPQQFGYEQVDGNLVF